MFINFIIELPLYKRKDMVYITIFVVVDRYTKIIRHLLITIKYIIIKLINILFKEVFLRYKTLENIIINRSSLSISNY